MSRRINLHYVANIHAVDDFYKSALVQVRIRIISCFTQYLLKS